MLKYSVSAEKPNTHYYEVRIHVSDFKYTLPDPRNLHFFMPVWTPGSYLLREFSRNVLDFEGRSIDTGKTLKSQKASKNEWVVETDDSDSIEITYKVYAFELTVNSSYLDNKHGIINGASVFMYVRGLENVESKLEVIPYPEWKVFSTGLERVKSSENWHFSVPNFDVLIDSPIEIGNQNVHEFNVNGTDYEVSIFSIGKFDEIKFTSDIKKIVESTVKVFEDIPYKRYVFICDFTSDSYGGLEHLNSTHCLGSIFRLEPVQEYNSFLSLFSHEFLHAWNVKRMRPKGLGPFDYTKETYTKSLWISEGITSYYDDLLLRRAEIYSVSEYLEAFSQNVSLMKSLPGSRFQSAQEASFDTWIKHYRQNENSPNVTFSYYTQGAVIGWMLDMEIRKSTHLAKTLDDVMRKAYEETFLRENRGFADEEFQKICSEVSGTDSVDEIFVERVAGRKDVDFDRYLGYAGLKILPKKTEKGKGFIGIRLKEESGRITVATVLSSSPAETAGLAASDEIIGANGIRMDRSRFSFYLSNRKPGESINLTTSRFGSIFQVEATVAEKPTLEFRVTKTDQANEEEKELFENWLGTPWSHEITYEDYRASPARTSVLDYV